MERKIEYIVGETTWLEVKGDDVKDWVTHPAWSITRIESGTGWSITKYRDKKSAEAVKAFLDLFSPEEAP